MWTSAKCAVRVGVVLAFVGCGEGAMGGPAKLEVLIRSDWSYSWCTAMSSDGRVVVVKAGTGDGQPVAPAYRWTRRGGYEAYEPIRVTPFLISMDGLSYITSAYPGMPNVTIVHASGAIGMMGPSWLQFGLSDDGGTYVRSGCLSGSNCTQGWAPNFPREEFPPELQHLLFQDVSGDGQVAIGMWGWFRGASVYDYQQRRLIELRRPDGGEVSFQTVRLSRNGRFATGLANVGSTSGPFRWSEETGVVPMEAGDEIIGISDDGRFCYGTALRDGVGTFAQLWGDGRRWDLGSYLIQRGALIPEGSRLYEVVGMSKDGHRVCGTMLLSDGLPAGFVATIGSECAADVDNGDGLGVPDDAVTIDDLMYFLDEYAAGRLEADVDDGSASGVRDGAVTIEDLLYYLERYAAGC